LCEAVAQQTEMLFVAFRRGGFDQLARLNGANERISIVFIQALPYRC
jgi:galactokinase